jgi:hypothetical protein
LDAKFNVYPPLDLWRKGNSCTLLILFRFQRVNPEMSEQVLVPMSKFSLYRKTDSALILLTVLLVPVGGPVKTQCCWFQAPAPFQHEEDQYNPNHSAGSMIRLWFDNWRTRA